MSERFLLDANMSPLTRTFLVNELGLDVVHVRDLDAHRFDDLDIVELAKRTSRVIITHDLDFGEIFHRRERGSFGVILMRVQVQTVESANSVLGRFLRLRPEDVELDRSLVVLDEHRFRIYTEP